VRRRIRSLINLTPETARVTENGRERVCPVGDIRVGSTVLVRPGERIPLDGVVAAGTSSVNQAPITGESRVVAKRQGDEVFAGSLNGSGALTIEVRRPYYDTTLANIVRKVEQAQAERAPLQMTGERFARIYTPVVVTLAALVTIVPPLVLGQPFGTWFYRALVLLVIACPCALVISTPVTIVSGIANAARRGVLIKGGRHLEAMANLDAVAFDKTGTLTFGASQVTDVIPLNSMSPAQIIRLAAVIESKSEHPLAGAVLKSVAGEAFPPEGIRFQHFESLAGRGVTATIDGQSYFAGNHALVEEMNLCSDRVEGILESLESKGRTTIIIGTHDQPIGIMGITDAVRGESAGVIKALHDLGIRKTIMLTGDSASIAEEIAAGAGIDEVYAHLLPEMKTRRIAALRETYGNVAMVGDGINDAPALAAATVGIAMGGGGTDVAAETADIVLMADDLTRIPQVVAIGRKTISIIKQNIAFALIVKLIFIGFGIFGGVSLWFAILADDGATLLVILNGMRALRSGPVSGPD
jgi:Cd2+/Zn2+-exporting ATPase